VSRLVGVRARRRVKAAIGLRAAELWPELERQIDTFERVLDGLAATVRAGTWRGPVQPWGQLAGSSALSIAGLAVLALAGWGPRDHRCDSTATPLTRPARCLASQVTASSDSNGAKFSAAVTALQGKAYGQHVCGPLYSRSRATALRFHSS
jgi:hypothetical protein